MGLQNNGEILQGSLKEEWVGNKVFYKTRVHFSGKSGRKATIVKEKPTII